MNAFLVRWWRTLEGLGSRGASPGKAPSRGRIGLGVERLEERQMLSVLGASAPGSAERAFVQELYSDVLNRAGGAGEVAFFLNQLDAGFSYSQVADEFLNSQEYRTILITTAFAAPFLGRAPSIGDVNFFSGALAGGLDEPGLTVAVLSSAEYFAVEGGTNAGFVDGLYNDVLGRAATAGESAFWIAQLGAGASQSAVAAAFVNSVEGRARSIGAVYVDFLGRPVDAGGLAFWQSFLASGGGFQQFRSGLLVSAEQLQNLTLLSATPRFQAGNVVAAPQAGGLSATDVEQLLRRAAAASASQDFIIAVVDRGGHILGVRTEATVDATFAGNPEGLAFAIDGAVAKARTAAFFANDQAPLTSRTVRFISQSTVTEREVESNPNITTITSTERGPGFVAPIGLAAHFPPDIPNTPEVDLFAIEHTNRDGTIHPSTDRVLGTADDVALDNRFNVDSAFIPPGQGIDPPDSYGFLTGLNSVGASRGIATLPGGIPIFKVINGQPALVGGIGVFFPGPDGFATHEQAFVPGVNQTTRDRTNAPRVLEAEWIAFAAVSSSADRVGGLNTIVAPVANVVVPEGRLDLVGVTLEVYGPHPQAFEAGGIERLLQVRNAVGLGSPNSGTDRPIDIGPDNVAVSGDERLHAPNRPVPDGWLVTPHDSPTTALTAADVIQIVQQGVNEANLTRAAIRTPAGQRTRMILSVTDTDGNVLGIFRMPDATFFSIDVATAKARNVSYYADAGAIQNADRLDPLTGNLDLPAGAAFSNRTFRFLALPRFPSAAEGSPAGPFSIVFDPGINPVTAENLGAPTAANAFQTVLGFDAFNPGTNFHDQPATLNEVLNQNGIVFFPGSAPIYRNGILVGGFGVSGDGVDQDDVVTFGGQAGFEVPPGVVRADDVFLRGVRLPYQKFLRNPQA